MRMWKVTGSFGEVEVAADDVLDAIGRANMGSDRRIVDIQTVEEIDGEAYKRDVGSVEKVEPDSLGGRDVWGVALEHSPVEFDMVGGPWDTLEEAMKFSLGLHLDPSQLRIVHASPGGPRKESTFEATHSWNLETGVWMPHTKWLRGE